MIAKVKKETIQRLRTYGGEVVIPVGRSVTVTAPLAGTVQLPEKLSSLQAGMTVDPHQVVLELKPLLSPERYILTPAEQAQMASARASILSLKIIADGDVKRGKAEVEAAQIALRRAEQLLRDKAGSERDRDNALATLKVAEKALEAAQQRHDQLADLQINDQTAQAKIIDIPTPQYGILRQVMVASGQKVATGAPLFEVVDLRKVWIRVPVYVSEQRELNLEAPGAIGELGAMPNGNDRYASPIPAPPSATPLASSVDLYYEMENKDGALKPGERVSVTIPLQGTKESPVVPHSAILHDIYGGTWVYEKVRANEFRRQRVLIDHIQGENAVLAHGPAVGTEIVTDGSAELFGTELGTGK